MGIQFRINNVRHSCAFTFYFDAPEDILYFTKDKTVQFWAEPTDNQSGNFSPYHTKCIEIELITIGGALKRFAALSLMGKTFLHLYF